MSKDEEALVEKVALAIERADREQAPDADGFDHPEISDWGVHLARAAIAALRSSPAGVRKYGPSAGEAEGYSVDDPTLRVRSAREYLAKACEAKECFARAANVRRGFAATVGVGEATRAIDTAIRDSLAAGREQGVEEAAKVADHEWGRRKSSSGTPWNDACRHIAQAIRSLSHKDEVR